MPTRRFHLHPAGLLITLAALALCLNLGFWQLDRAEEKTTLLASMESRGQLAPVPLDELLAMVDPAHFPVHLEGHFDNRHPILLDNRMVEGIAGYHLLSPFQTRDGHWLLVNRGWLPRGRDRAQLPAIADISGPVTVTGHSYMYSDKTFTLAEDDLQEARWPLRLQKIEMQTIGQLLGVELAPFEIRVAPGARVETGEQLPRPWQAPEASVLGPERHRAYAVQWFSLAAAAVLIFIAASYRKTGDD